MMSRYNAAVAHQGFFVQVHSPAAKFVNEASLRLVSEGDLAALYEAMRQQLLPVPREAEFTVALPGFVPTMVIFRSMPSAAMAMLGRAHQGAAVPDLHGAAFIFSGKSKADEDEVIRRTSGGRDVLGKPYPIPPAIYERIRGEAIRPFLGLTLWNVDTANDPSLFAIPHAIAGVFLEACADAE